MSSALPLRPNACLLIFNRDRKLFLGERLDQPGVWQLPQGGIEPNLSLEENVLREAHEELGADLHLLKIVQRLAATHVYEYDSPPSWSAGKWRGQSQTFWLLEFLGKDSDIQLDRFEAEFMGFRWSTADEVREIAEPKRLPGYLKPLEEFEEFLRTASS